MPGSCEESANLPPSRLLLVVDRARGKGQSGRQFSVARPARRGGDDLTLLFGQGSITRSGSQKGAHRIDLLGGRHQFGSIRWRCEPERILRFLIVKAQRHVGGRAFLAEVLKPGLVGDGIKKGRKSGSFRVVAASNERGPCGYPCPLYEFFRLFWPD